MLGLLVVLATGQASASLQCGEVCLEWRRGLDEVSPPGRLACSHRSGSGSGEDIAYTVKGRVVLRVKRSGGVDPSQLCSPQATWVAIPGQGTDLLRFVRTSRWATWGKDQVADVSVPLRCGKEWSLWPSAWVNEQVVRVIFGCGHGAMVGQVSLDDPSRLWFWLTRPSSVLAHPPEGAELFLRKVDRPDDPLQPPK